MKKVLSLLLSVLMVVTMLPLSGVTALAEDASDFKHYDVTIAVPETVYMKPQSNYTTKGTEVQYYVNNNVDESGNVSLDNSRDATAGTFSVYGEDIESIDSVSVDGATRYGFKISQNGKRFYDDSFTLELTEGISSAETKLLEWTIDCTMTDGTNAEFKAFTVAYAPYLEPAVSAIRVKNCNGDDSFCQSLGYISGIQGIGGDGDYYSASNFLPLVTAYDDMKGSGTQRADAFLSSSQVAGLPNKNVNYSDYAPDSWIAAINYVEAQQVTPWGMLTIDTSRYTNLNQVPNLTLGLSITDTENADVVYGYIGKFDISNSYWKYDSGKPKAGQDYISYSTSSSESYNYVLEHHKGTYPFGAVNYFTYGRPNSNSLYDGGNVAILYTDILWYEEIETGEQNYYAIQGARTKQNVDNAVNTHITRLNVNGVDKSGLRSAVQKYEAYGLQREWFSYKALYDAYLNELKDAATRLGDPVAYDTSYDKLEAAFTKLMETEPYVSTDNGYYNITATKTGNKTYQLSAEHVADPEGKTVQYEYVLHNNLLKNGNFGSGGKGWSNEDTDFVINDGYERGNAFATKNQLHELSQTVALTDFYTEEELNTGDIRLTLGGDVYNIISYGALAKQAKLYVEILDGNGELINTVYALNNVRDSDDTYISEDGTFSEDFTLPTNARSLNVVCAGQDGLAWMGYYGPRFDNIYLSETGNESPALSEDNTFEFGKFNIDISAKYTVLQNYQITTEAAENGTVTTDKSVTYETDTVTITATGDKGYVVNTLTVTDADGNKIAVTDNQFTMPSSDVTVSATFVPAEYVERVEPYIDENGAYIVGNVAYYTDGNGNNYAVNEDGSVGDQLDSVELSYFEFADISDNTCRVSFYTGSYDDLENGELIIPKTYNGKKVTAVGEFSSEKFTFMEKTTGEKKQFVLTLNENIEEIASYAFYKEWVTKVQGDTSNLKILNSYAFADANEPSGYTLDIQLDYPGRIYVYYRLFDDLYVTARIKHDTEFSQDVGYQKDITYVYTDPHIYSDPQWAWADDYSSATATFTCGYPSCRNEETVDATVTTAHKDGNTTFTATVEFEGKTYTATVSLNYVEKVEPYIDENGAYIVGNVAYYYYTDRLGYNYAVNEDGSVGDQLDSVELSYFEFGDFTDDTCRVLFYTGSYDDLENGELVIPKTYYGKKVIAVGKFSDEKFTFMEKTTGEKKQFVLTLNENIEEIASYAFYKEWVTKVQGDTSNLKILNSYAFADANEPSGYTLDIQLDYPGRIYVYYRLFDDLYVTARIKHDTEFSQDVGYQKDITYVYTDPHIYSDPQWAWADDYSSATATFTCGYPFCRNQETVAATVTAEDKDGVRTYTATVEFEGETYTDTKVTAIPLDTDAYYAALAEANALKETDLMQYEDYETFLAEIDGAEVDFAAATTQAEVDAATARIIAAIENLKKGYIEPEYKGTCNIVGLGDIIIMTNGKSEYEAQYDEKVYLLAPDADAKFAYTNADGSEIYAYLSSNILYAPKNNTIYIKAVSTVTEGKAFIAGTSFENRKAKYNCQYSVPDGATDIETGIVMSFDKATTLELGADGARAFKANKIGAQHEYSIVFNISDGNMGKTIYAKSYLTYTLNGETITVYSDQHNIQLKED